MVGRVDLTFASMDLLLRELYLEYWFLWTAFADVHALKKYSTYGEHLQNTC